MSVAGLVLAAGAGSRFGGPKVLARDSDGTAWVDRTVAALREGGCSPIVIAVGAEREKARERLADLEGVDLVVDVAHWMEGISASILGGLDALRPFADVEAAVIVPVDVPTLSAAMVQRVLGGVRSRYVSESASDSDRFRLLGSAQRQATFGGRPGHPVLIGREHWAALAEVISGDIGARPYLVAHGVQEIDCSDLGSGEDVDTR